MTLPIQSVKYVRSTYEKFIILTICFAVLTAIAAFLAAISSYHLSNLSKSQTAAVKISSSAADKANAAMNKEIEQLKTKLTEAQGRLEKEKSTSKALQVKIVDLENQLAAIAQAASSKLPGEATSNEPPAQTAPETK